MSLSGSRVIESARRRQVLKDRSEATSGSVRAQSTDLPAERYSEPLPLQIQCDQVIPAQRWKLWLMAALSMAFLAGLLEAWHWTGSGRLGDSTNETLRDSVERALVGTGAATWWLTAQLCLLGWWIRSHSRIDYEGRFHAWGWAAGGFIAAAAVSFTGLHLLAAQWLMSATLTSTASSPKLTVAWLVPCALSGLALWATLGSELRDCITSRFLHVLAGICGVTLVTLEFWPSMVPTGWNASLFSRSLLGLMQWSNLWTVAMHLHRLVHVTPDPPEGSSAWTVVRERGLDQGWIWLTSRFGRRSRSRIDDLLESPVAATADLQATAMSTVDAIDRGGTNHIRIDAAETVSKNQSRRAKKRAKR